MDYDEELRFVYLLERIGEPLYMGPKGHGETKYLYNLPTDYLEAYETKSMIELRKLIPPDTNCVEIPVKKTNVPYDLSPIQEAVPKQAVFSELNSVHLQAATELTKILTSQSTKEDFFNASGLCRDSVNSHLWVHAFTTAILRRPDMKGFRIPAIWETMPDMFIEAKPWKEAVKQATLPPSERGIIVIDKSFSGTNLDPHHKVAYFMQDIGANAHHWHWHVIIPFNSPKGTVDRHGEMFWYMHHGMLARYDAERLSNGLNRVVPFDIHKDLIEEACFPKLTIQNSGTAFASRQEYSILRDYNRSRDPATNGLGFVTIQDIRTWCNRIVEAIDAGFAIQEGGGRIDLRTDKGIDVVPAMWESSLDTPHMEYYGVAHNAGHLALSFAHDPDFRYKLIYVGATRSNVSYWNIHEGSNILQVVKYLDLLSQRQKDYLLPYSHQNLQWEGITVVDIQVVRAEDSRLPVSLNPSNNLLTFWMQTDIEVSRGLDFGRTNLNGLGSVWVRATHLQHLPFQYRIRVHSQEKADVQATVRIFMAPKLDENGDKLPFFDQRVLFFEMDKFTSIIHPGENVIIQKSDDSTLTIPWSQTFREIERDLARPTNEQAICSCGWPDHLLLPRGTEQGMPFDLFVMLTNSLIDQNPLSRRQIGTTVTAKGNCRDSVSYCGVMDDKFPDLRPMGYPFDRPAVPDERLKLTMMLSDFVTPVTNMASTEIKIFHVDKTILRGNGAPDNIRKVNVAP